MIYAVKYKIDGICGPGGAIDTSRERSIEFAKSMAENALDQVGDWANEYEWFDFDGEEADPRKLLKSDDLDEVADVIGQISDFMKVRELGYVDLKEYQNLFDLIEEESVENWCSPKLKRRIGRIRKAHFALIDDISAEWASV